MEVSICERFPGLTPFRVRQERASEVFLLIRRLNDYNERQGKENGKQKKKVIRRPAGDSWF